MVFARAPGSWDAAEGAFFVVAAFVVDALTVDVFVVVLAVPPVGFDAAVTAGRASGAAEATGTAIARPAAAVAATATSRTALRPDPGPRPAENGELWAEDALDLRARVTRTTSPRMSVKGQGMAGEI